VYIYKTYRVFVHIVFLNAVVYIMQICMYVDMHNWNWRPVRSALVYVSVYIRAYVHMCTHLWTCICMYVYVYVNVYTQVCSYMYVHNCTWLTVRGETLHVFAFKHVDMQIFVYCIHAYIYMNLYIYVYMYIHIWMYTYVYIYMYVYICVYTCIYLETWL